MTASQLIGMNIRYAVYRNQLYFDVLEIKALLPNKKFPAEKIKQLPIGGRVTNTIKASDIQNMTDFDKNIVQFMKVKKQ
jgi:hypothetical protein